MGPASFSGLVRGRTPDEAIRRATDVPDAVEIAVEAEADVHGWQTVLFDGAPMGRVRPHQRMRFRRD